MIGPTHAAGRWAPSMVFAVSVVSFTLWSLLSPSMSVPDEPAHVVKAASLWSGQLRGEAREVDTGNPAIPIPMLMDLVVVPSSYAEVDGVAGCFAFKPLQPAACAPSVGGDRAPTEAMTSAGRYPPMFYAAVGWPAAIFGADIGVPLMRLTSAVISAALLAAAFAALRRVVRADVAFVAVAVAAVPMLHFLAGSVNPNGVEIAAAIAFWCAAFALVRCRLDAVPPGRALGSIYVVSGIALVASRPLSPAFAVLVVVWSLLLAGWPDVRRVVVDRTWWLLNVPIGAIAALSVVWVIVSDGLGGMFGGRVPENQGVFAYLVGRVDDYLLQAVALFGWMDNGPLPAVVYPWLAACVAIIALGLLFARRGWDALVLLALCVTGVMLPAVLQFPSAEASGVAWQGRYGLPVLVGIPILAVVVLRTWIGGNEIAVRRLLFGTAVVVAFGLSVAGIDTLQRYAVGDQGEIAFAGIGVWAPVMGNGAAIVLTVLSGVSYVVLTWWFVRTAGSVDPATTAVGVPLAAGAGADDAAG